MHTYLHPNNFFFLNSIKLLWLIQITLVEVCYTATDKSDKHCWDKIQVWHLYKTSWVEETRNVANAMCGAEVCSIDSQQEGLEVKPAGQLACFWVDCTCFPVSLGCSSFLPQSTVMQTKIAFGCECETKWLSVYMYEPYHRLIIRIILYSGLMQYNT